MSVCALYDVGDQDGTAFLVMQYLNGEPLANRLHRNRLPFSETLTIATQVAAALDNAHRAGIVHGDLKPANIFLTDSGVKLVDFGLATLYRREPQRGRLAPWELRPTRSLWETSAC